MAELLLNFEKLAGRFEPAILIISGLVVGIVGLCLWLGGLLWGRIVSGYFGAIIGGLTGLAIWPSNVIAIFLSSLGAAIAAIFLTRFFLTLLSTLLTITIITTFFTFNHLQPVYYYGRQQIGKADAVIPASETLDIIKVHLQSFFEQTRHAFSTLHAGPKTTIIVIAIAVIIISIFLYKLITALSCAVVGTAFVFAGMVLLLIQKRVTPIEHIIQKPFFFKVVFFAMVVFGTIVQFLLAHKKSSKTVNKEKQKQGEE